MAEQSLERRKPARRPLPAHLLREPVVYPVPSACPCYGGALHKLGEDVTESRNWCRGSVIQHVREKLRLPQLREDHPAPARSHPIVRGRAGPASLAHVLFSKYGLHRPLDAL